MQRRNFIKTTTGAALTALAGTSYTLALSREQRSAQVKAGIITDLHFGNLAPDASARFDVFAKAVAKEKPDYIIQLGDFCHPEKGAEALMKQWNAVAGDKYHVLGNHDMDKGSKADIQKLWGMEKRYYHFDKGGWRFIVLDMNNLKKGDKYTPYNRANFYVAREQRTWADPEQLEWLDKTLAESELPVMIYTHQPIGNSPDSPQQKPILEIIKKHRFKKSGAKTKAVICGHQHQDWHKEVDGVHHICINSASYQWIKGPWKYQDSLFTFLEIKDGKLTLTGMKTKWVKQPPGVKIDPAISAREIKI